MALVIVFADVIPRVMSFRMLQFVPFFSSRYIPILPGAVVEVIR